MRRLMRWLAAASLLGMLVPVLPVGVALADDAVVSGACLEADFDTALETAQTNGGGTITFDCGVVDVIAFTGVKTISAPNVVVIDGGGVMALDGQDLYQLFSVEEGATLELRDITLVNGHAEEGGAVHNLGTLRIVGSTIESSTADDSSSGGGAVFNGESGTLEIIDSEFVENAGHPGGAGGAIVNIGVMTMTGSLLAGNSGGVFGGALANTGVATISESTFFNNNALFGAAVLNFGTLDLTASTLHQNIGDGGGGFYNLGTLTVTSSTLSGNEAAIGAAILNASAGTVQMIASTVTGNASTNTASLDNLQVTTGSFSLRQTIVADQASGADCAGVITSNGNNLDSDDSCELDASGDISGGNAQLGALANNGGATETHLPAATSDAINAGGNGCPATDQRGEPRPSGGACDIGSVELQGSSAAALCANRYTGALTSSPNGVCGAGTVAIQTPSPVALTFCVNPYSGEVIYAPRGTCTGQWRAHVVPDNGDLLTCVSRYTGAHRWVPTHARCTAGEIPHTLSATL